MADFKMDLGLRNFSETAIKDTPELDESGVKDVTPYGIQYLDRCLYGVGRDELVLIGAPSGLGKTELASQIAMNATLNHGKRVVMMALEAVENEIELRTKFKLYSRLLRKHHQLPDWFNYQDFKYGQTADLIRPFIGEVNEELAKFKSMQTFYRSSSFGVDDFKRVFNYLNDKVDLVVVDHLHYFDLDDENENKAVSSIMKTMRDLVQVTQIPVVLVAHIRKSNKEQASICATQEDFMGTSNIYKVPTTIITLGKGGLRDKFTARTYFRVAKCRSSSAVSNYIGLGHFDFRTNEYEEKFVIGEEENNRFRPLGMDEIPAWYLRRIK